MFKKFNTWDIILGWVAFAIAAVTYLLTLEPTASFWDCGEFISSAYKLDVGHPPGAPFFMMAGHFFSLFASDPSHVAMCVNALSALASAGTILFLFWTITALAKKLITPDTLGKSIAILGAGMVGALAYTWSDTFWFSAVEGEVYGSSSFFTAVVFWLILKWDECADEAGSDKWLLLIAYLMGLSIGVHLLNLLTIPAIVLVYYFRKYKFSWKGAILAFLISCIILAVILYGIIPGWPTVAGWFELFFTNTLGCPFNTGLAVEIVLTVVLLVAAIWWSYTKMAKKASEFWRWTNTALIAILLILIGYSTYGILVIRSSADTPMDQNSPDNVFSLKYYLNREQYGDRPLFYGQTYSAPVNLIANEAKGLWEPEQKQGEAKYAPAPHVDGQPDKYVITGYKTQYVYNKDFCMLFPRMYSSQGSHVQAYKEWGDIKGRRVRYQYAGEWRSEICPTFVENMRFFFSYQVNYMYWRYFMWNFAGRQNDLQGYGELHKGNWICGIPFIDNLRLGDQSLLPDELKENKGHNVYYLLPLLLGILGICWQLGKGKEGGKNFTLVFLLFFLTGLAIVLYLNQTPYQPRERDYAYAGSFYAFCIWIGMGVLLLYEAIAKWAQKNKALDACAAALVTVICLLVPVQMASQNWDDHDRSQRYSCRDFGANYLKSCESEGVIFTNGDNDTFPLWYNQEVEGVGTDLRVCNLSYLQTDWYIAQMKRPYYDSPALPISWEYKDYMPDHNEVAWVDNQNSEPVSVTDAFLYLRSGKHALSGDESFLPSNKLYISTPDSSRIFFKSQRRYLRSEMMIMEMLNQNHWKRPFYFAVTVGNDYYLGLEPYFELTGLAYHVTPVRSEDGRPRVNTDLMYENMMHRFCYGNMNIPGIYIDENLMRMCRTHRMMFAQLAEALYNESAQAEFRAHHDPTLNQTQRDAMLKEAADKKAKITEVLDYCAEVLPEYNIPYDYTTLGMAEMYLRVDQTEKGDAMLRKLMSTCGQYLTWGASLNKNQRRSAEATLGQQRAIMQNALYIANQAHRDSLVSEFYPILESVSE